MPMPLRLALNALATESFRDQADRDYVLARSAWRLRLRDQFHWSALQAIEKYLKGILLFAGRSARYRPGTGRREFSHSLSALDDAVHALPGYQFSHPTWWREYLAHIEASGMNRYLTRSTSSRWDALEKLDEAIWSIRRYCKHMDFTHRTVKGETIQMLPVFMHDLNMVDVRSWPSTYGIMGGQIELWLKKKTEPARAALIWNNRMWSRAARSKRAYTVWSSSVIAPLDRGWAQDPGLRKELEEYVRFS